MAAGNSYCLGINSNVFFLKDNKKAFILWLNAPKVTAYTYFKWILGIAVPLLLAWFANSYNKTSNKVFENEKHLLKIEYKVNNMQRQKNDSIEHKK